MKGKRNERKERERREMEEMRVGFHHVKPSPNGFASSYKLYLRSDVNRVTKRTSKFPRKYRHCTQVAKNAVSCISLANRLL